MPNLKLKTDEFVDLVRRSGLVEEQRLSAVLAEQDAETSDDGSLGDSLVRAGLLTNWQVSRLSEGRCKGFFLGNYKLLDHIGSGGMGAVYLGEHKVMHRRVAIKVLPQNRAAEGSYLKRFHQEARAVAALDHPNIVRAFDVDQENDVHYLVMEYIDGLDMQTLVAHEGPLPFKKAADFAKQAAEGLQHAHEAGLIHRDVKPANLLIDRQGVVKLLDLGLARFTDESKASLSVIHDDKLVGTVDYLAPEQAINSRVDGRADVYSLGCTLYYMLTGRAPFPEGSIAQRIAKHQTVDPTSIREFRPDVSEGLVAICNRMMSKLPELRFQSAADVSAALASWLEGGGESKGFRGLMGSLNTFTPPSPPLPGQAQAPIQDEEILLLPENQENSQAATETTINSGEASSGETSVGRGPKRPPSAGRSAQRLEGRPDGSGLKPGSNAGRPTQRPATPGAKKPGSGVKPGGSDLKPGGSGLKPGGSELKPGSGVKAGSDIKPGSSGLKPGSGITPGEAAAVGLKPGDSGLSLHSTLPPMSSGVKGQAPTSGLKIPGPPAPTAKSDDLLDDLLEGNLPTLSNDPLAGLPVSASGPMRPLTGSALGAPAAKPKAPKTYPVWMLLLVGLALALVVIAIGSALYFALGGHAEAPPRPVHVYAALHPDSAQVAVDDSNVE